MDGIINLDKPAGISSARAVSRVKRLIPRGTRIGHAGTLDPFATGVLLLLIGKATKCCERLMDTPKQYECCVKLGFTTETDDPESAETPVAPSGPPPERSKLDQVLNELTGEIFQRPPVYSALKVGGRRAYQLARKDQPVQLEPRRVKVYSIELLEYQWPYVCLRIDCGRGTYIRAIARDLGEQLELGGYLTELRRTSVGSFDVANAVTLEALEQEGVAAFLKPVMSG